VYNWLIVRGAIARLLPFLFGLTLIKQCFLTYFLIYNLEQKRPWQILSRIGDSFGLIRDIFGKLCEISKYASNEVALKLLKAHGSRKTQTCIKWKRGGGETPAEVKCFSIHFLCHPAGAPEGSRKYPLFN